MSRPAAADPRKALVLFSGGQDSAVCLAWALERNLGLATPMEVQTPLMFIDKAATWPLVDALGGVATSAAGSNDP